MLSRLLFNFFSNAPSWCWQYFNSSNNPTRLLYTCSLLVFALSWMLFIKKSRNNVFKKKKSRNKQHPPLPPGPRVLPLVGNLLSLEPELHTYFATLARTYGPIFTLWLGKKLTLVVTSPAIAREMLKDNEAVFADRDVLIAVKIFSYGAREVAWSPYGIEWRMLRKVFVHEMLNNATLDSVYSLRRQEIRKTIGYLHSQVGIPLNIGEQFYVTALNVVTNMMWGSTMRDKDMARVMAELQQLIAEIIRLLEIPNISDTYSTLAWFDLQGIEKKAKGLVKRLDVIFDGIIDQRLKMNAQSGTGKMNGGKENKDFLQFLLKVKDEGDAKTPLTMIHVKALLMDMVMGGVDTTVNSLEFAMAEIMNKSEVMERVKQELDTVVGKDNTVEESHIPKLPYLYAIMKETLRLHPIIPFLARHYQSETCIIGGYKISKGARILINVWAMQRDPSVWKNPMEFDPERFLNGKWDYSGKELDYSPFGFGRRNCAGIAMAQRMFMFLLASLLHSFDWKLPEGESMDVSEKFGFLLKKKTPLVVIPTPRLSDPALYQ